MLRRCNHLYSAGRSRTTTRHSRDKKRIWMRFRSRSQCYGAVITYAARGARAANERHARDKTRIWTRFGSQSPCSRVSLQLPGAPPSCAYYHAHDDSELIKQYNETRTKSPLFAVWLTGAP
jgi:hypothetical protein